MPASENSLVDLRPGGRISRDDVQYSEADGCFHVQVHVVGRPRHILGADIDEVVAQANDLIEGQSPHLHFHDAWKEGVALFPEYFHTDTGINAALDIYQFAPRTENQPALQASPIEDRLFVLTMWSFFRRTDYDSNCFIDSLPHMTELARSLNGRRKDILARLFINYRPCAQT